jgi:hypothetical protein
MATNPNGERLLPGTPVEVRTRYLSNWVAGFEVLTVDGDQVKVRRRSDGAVLPAPVAFEDVRTRVKAVEHR